MDGIARFITKMFQKCRKEKFPRNFTFQYLVDEFCFCLKRVMPDEMKECARPNARDLMKLALRHLVTKHLGGNDDTAKRGKNDESPQILMFKALLILLCEENSEVIGEIKKALSDTSYAGKSSLQNCMIFDGTAKFFLKQICKYIRTGRRLTKIVTDIKEHNPTLFPPFERFGNVFILIDRLC